LIATIITKGVIDNSALKNLVIFQVSCYHFTMKKNKKSFDVKDKATIIEAIVGKLQ